jgi:hypothetical protein
VKHTNIRQQDLFLNEAPYAFEYDFSRLKTARDKVYTLMKDSKWRTQEIWKMISGIRQGAVSSSTNLSTTVSKQKKEVRSKN